MLVMQLWMQDGEDDLSTIVSVWNNSLMETKLFSDTSWPNMLGMALMREWQVNAKLFVS